MGKTIIWSEQPLGKVTDASLADELGVHESTVAYHRRALHIAPLSPKGTGIDWDAQPLGQLPDLQLALSLGVTATTVRNQRIRRGIPKFSKYAQTP